MKLVLGVIDIPRAQDTKTEKPQKGRRRTVNKRESIDAEFATTGDVAEWLEKEYHLMQTFLELHKDRIEAEAKACLDRTIANIVIGAPLDSAQYAFSELEEQVTIMFKRWLSENGPAEAGIPGTPTKAALAGVNHRMKHPYAKRGPRISFIDTGQYQATFKAWVI